MDKLHDLVLGKIILISGLFLNPVFLLSGFQCTSLGVPDLWFRQSNMKILAGSEDFKSILVHDFPDMFYRVTNQDWTLEMELF